MNRTDIEFMINVLIIMKKRDISIDAAISYWEQQLNNIDYEKNLKKILEDFECYFRVDINSQIKEIQRMETTKMKKIENIQKDEKER